MHVQAGGIMPYYRENYAFKQGELRHLARFGRPPAYIRAGALICWSGRPDMYGRAVETDFLRPYLLLSNLYF